MPKTNQQVAATQVCPVCKGEKVVLRRNAAVDQLVGVICEKCKGAGTVPPEGDLAQWQKEADALLDDIAGSFDSAGPTHSVYMLRTHLAAMPAQPDVNGELLAALRVLGSGSAKEQLEYLHERGLVAPETRYGDSQRPETYQITNDYEMDADGVYPACDSLARAVVRAAIAAAEKGAVS